jgi:hypothetical protein
MWAIIQSNMPSRFAIHIPEKKIWCRNDKEPQKSSRFLASIDLLTVTSNFYFVARINKVRENTFSSLISKESATTTTIKAAELLP